MSRRRTRRRGALMVAVLVCLALIAVIGGALLRLVLLERGLLDARERQCQSRWLVEAGLQRAAARLATDAGYRGETWSLPADELAGRDGAVVRIEVSAAADRPGWRKVSVEADYPRDAGTRARTSKQIEFESPPSGETQ